MPLDQVCGGLIVKAQKRGNAMSRVRPLVAGNWKMNGLGASLGEIEALRAGVADGGLAANTDVMICPPATLISRVAQVLAGNPVAVGGQDCHAETSGAFTGEISAPMLADAGATAVILGHSERRSLYGERDRDVKAKAEAAMAAGLLAIVCVGETQGERRLGLTIDVVGRQLAGSLPGGAAPASVVIAYEPVWAIGTGLTPTNADIEEVHAAIRARLGTLLGNDVAEETRILYGGSVKPANASELLTIPGVNGALVGGASLQAPDFLAIAAAQNEAAGRD
jgi:triosephosphate isomerase